MGVDTSVGPLEAIEDAMSRVRASGLEITSEASDELSELVLASFRKMQESRILDLRSDAPERVEKEQLANANLMKLVDEWVRLERSRGNTELTLGGFRRTYASVCPVYPCGE